MSCSTRGRSLICYGAIFSSTFPIGRKFTERQKEVYNVALAATNTPFHI